MDRIRNSFRQQAAACRTLGSPFTALVCEVLAERLDDDSAFGRRILAWPGDPGGDALALRAAGAFHALARSGGSTGLAASYPPHHPTPDELWSALKAAIGANEAFLEARLDSPPQTNEVKRCAVLLGGCLHIAAETGLALSILEVGSSAGLNLALDHYRYDLGCGSWGDPASAVRIRSEWQGNHPPLAAPLVVASRRGCDLRPLDPRSPSDREHLLSFVWADQSDRLATTAAALTLAAEAPWRVEKADAADWLEERLKETAPGGQARVIMHSIVWQYLPHAVQNRIAVAIQAAGDNAGAQAPVAWLRMEPDGRGEGTGVYLTLWPEGGERLLGRADFHGRWVHWGEGSTRT